MMHHANEHQKLSESHIHPVEIIALDTPRVLNHCRRCQKAALFYCSDKFRVNAQQKTIDVWLIYKCVHCDSTWNYPVLSRTHTRSINGDLHRRWMDNDKETAWEYAFQTERLRKFCHDVMTAEVPYRLSMESLESSGEEIRLFLFSKYKWELRLDKVLKEITGMSRSRLVQLGWQGGIVTEPQAPVQSKLKHDLHVWIRAKVLE